MSGRAPGPVFDHTGMRVLRGSSGAGARESVGGSPGVGGAVVGLGPDTIAEVRGALAGGRVVLLRSFVERSWADEIRACAHDSLSREAETANRMSEQAAREPAPRASGADRDVVPGVPDHGRVFLEAGGAGSLARVHRTWLEFPWNPSPGGDLSVALALAWVRRAVEGHEGSGGLACFPGLELEHASPGEDLAGAEKLSPAVEIDQYPRGGGHRARQPPREADRRVLCFAALSQRGRDFIEGGLFVETASGRVDVDGHLALGDVCLFRAALASEILPIDAGKGRAGQPDWHHPGGRWTLSPSARPAAEFARESFDRRADPTITPRADSLADSPADAASRALDLPPDDVTAEWCSLVGIRHVGQRVGPAVVESIEPGEVRFRWPEGSAPLAVSCRPARKGPAFCSSARFALHYRLSGGRSLTQAEARFLHALCATTRAAEGRRAPR